MKKDNIFGKLGKCVICGEMVGEGLWTTNGRKWLRICKKKPCLIAVKNYVDERLKEMEKGE